MSGDCYLTFQKQVPQASKNRLSWYLHEESFAFIQLLNNRYRAVNIKEKHFQISKYITKLSYIKLELVSTRMNKLMEMSKIGPNK